MTDPTLPPEWWSDLCAIVVLFHPDESVGENLSVMVKECGRVLVVDNGTAAGDRERLAALPGVEWLDLGDNLGIAVALNRGLDRAVELGCRWAVTFDQDSRPESGMVRALWETLRASPRAAMVGPRIREEGGVEAAHYRWLVRHKTWPLLFQLKPCPNNGLPDVTIMITSGSLLDIGVWRELGGFAEGLFIDYVDIDFCLRVQRAGRTLAVAPGAILHHHLGAREKRMLLGRDFRPMNHAPFRHYYMARNRVVTWRRHALAVPHWAVFDGCFALYNAFRVLAFESNKWSKMKAIALGTWDGLLGRSGRCPARRMQSLQP